MTSLITMLIENLPLAGYVMLMIGYASELWTHCPACHCLRDLRQLLSVKVLRHLFGAAAIMIGYGLIISSKFLTQ